MYVRGYLQGSENGRVVTIEWFVGIKHWWSHCGWNVVTMLIIILCFKLHTDVYWTKDIHVKGILYSVIYDWHLAGIIRKLLLQSPTFILSFYPYLGFPNLCNFVGLWLRVRRSISFFFFVFFFFFISFDLFGYLGL